MNQPTYTDAMLAEFGCDEADEVLIVERLIGRDPHECVRCGKVDCVCTAEITPEAIHAARAAAGAKERHNKEP